MHFICTIIKVNIFQWSPNLGHNIISFYKIYTLNQICAVYNEVNGGNVHRYDKIYAINFMSRKYSMLANICSIYHICYGQWLVLVGSKFHVIYQNVWHSNVTFAMSLWCASSILRWSCMLSTGPSPPGQLHFLQNLKPLFISDLIAERRTS